MLAIGGDHAATRYKECIKKHLDERKIEYTDFGTNDMDSCDYPDYALKVAEAVASGKCEKGILICGTGIGMSIAANKVKGIRCAHCTDTFSAKACRQHNDANVLAFGERVTGMGVALEIVDTFLDTQFSGDDRHIRRIDKTTAIEEKYFK